MAITKTAAKFRKTGDTLDYTPTADVEAGAVVKVCDLVCIALCAIPANTRATLKVLHRGEVVELETNEAIGETTAGTKIYVDSSGLATKTASGNTLVGCAAKAIGANDLSFEVVCA